jgi:osmoprotectant transport system substrate-binding protein
MVVRQALENGEIDLYMEYTGTAWMVHLGRQYSPTGHEELYYMTKAADAANGLIWLQPIWNHNSYALAVWPEFAQEHDVYTISDLARYSREMDGEVETFIDFEFSQRPDGWPALTQMYSFSVDDDYMETAAPGASLIALANRQVEVAMVFATDASIAKYGWVVLQDDKNFFPPYDLCVVARADVLEEYPEVAKTLNELVLTGFQGAAGVPFSSEKMMRGQKTWQMLNAAVDEEKKDASAVAHQLLFERNLN